MFLHASVLHIAFNMFALYVIGTPVEQYLGKARYLGLYFVSGLAGSAGALLQSPFTPVLGASGAIFGILGAMMVLEWQVTGRLAGQAAGLVAINLGLSFVIPGISWGGHVGGLIGGILVMLAYGHWGGRGRAQYGQLGLGGVLERNPFEVLDQDGVGELMRIAVERGRETKPEIKLGICGEHGGEPSSVAFCHQIGLDYVSCSPYRVPLARLAAAQAVLQEAHRAEYVQTGG